MSICSIKGLGLAWMRQIIAPEGLWLVGVYVKMEHHPEPVQINGMEVHFEKLKSKDELFNFLNEDGCTHAALMEFCEDYKNRYGNDLCWIYPIAGDSCLGEYLVLVKEGVLKIRRPSTIYIPDYIVLRFQCFAIRKKIDATHRPHQ